MILIIHTSSYIDDRYGYIRFLTRMEHIRKYAYFLHASLLQHRYEYCLVPVMTPVAREAACSQHGVLISGIGVTWVITICNNQGESNRLYF